MPRKNIITRSLKKRADSLLAANRLSEAAALYEKICKTDQRDVDARVMLAIVHTQRGDAGKAERFCKKALGIDPDHALAHHALGVALERQERLEEAVAEFREAIRLRPGFANAHLFLANALAGQGEYGEAEKHHRKALELAPASHQAMASLGTLYMNTGRYGEAEDWLRKALAIDPAGTEALINLGQALLAQGKDGEALPVFEQAARLSPDSYRANYALGNILTKTGQYDQALRCYEKAASIQPGDAYAVGAQAHVLERRGEIEAAFRLLAPFVESGPAHVGIALPFAELATRFGRQDDAIRLLQEVLSGDISDLQTRAEVHHKLGKLLDNTGDYDRSFEHYCKANEVTGRIVAETRGIDTIDAQAQRIANRVESLDRAFWNSLPRAGNRSRRPVFVVGMPRSGTTLVEQILASHPQVYGAGELLAMETIARSLCPGDSYRSVYPACLADVDEQILDRFAERHLHELAAMSDDADRVVDKCPHNFMHLGLISRLFPAAQVVHIERDPLDTCSSIYFQLFTPQHAYACDLQRLGRYYRVYRDLMACWNEVLDIPLLNIRYERLVAEPEATIRSLVEFCGLPWDDRCLEFHATRRDVNTPSYGQVRQPIYTRSVNRWKNYQSHLQPLMDALELSAVDQ